MGRTVDIFAWIWNIGVAVQSIHQLLSENDFETALATVFMAMAPKFWGSLEGRDKSKRQSQMPLASYNLLHSQNIPINQ